MMRQLSTLLVLLCVLDSADGLVAGASIRTAQPWPGHAEPSALLTAELEGGQVVGRCGLEVRALTEAGLTATDWPYNENAGATPQPRAYCVNSSSTRHIADRDSDGNSALSARTLCDLGARMSSCYSWTSGTRRPFRSTSSSATS